jgi:hypothetical protein
VIEKEDGKSKVRIHSEAFGQGESAAYESRLQKNDHLALKRNYRNSWGSYEWSLLLDEIGH